MHKAIAAPQKSSDEFPGELLEGSDAWNAASVTLVTVPVFVAMMTSLLSLCLFHS